MAWLYYHHREQRRNDKWILHVAICINLVSDALGTIAICASVYLFLVTHWGEETAIEIHYWPVAVNCFSSGISALVVQLFMIYRFWRMSSYHTVSCALVLSAVFAIVGTLATGITTAIHAPLKTRRYAKFFAIQSLAAGAGTDIMITISLIYALYRTKTYFTSTKALLHRIAALAIITGLVTTIIALIALITFLTVSISEITIAFSWLLGRTYTCTMLFTLLYRYRLRGDVFVPSTQATSPEGELKSFRARVSPVPSNSPPPCPRGPQCHGCNQCSNIQSGETSDGTIGMPVLHPFAPPEGVPNPKWNSDLPPPIPSANGPDLIIKVEMPVSSDDITSQDIQGGDNPWTSLENTEEISPLSDGTTRTLCQLEGDIDPSKND